MILESLTGVVLSKGSREEKRMIRFEDDGSGDGARLSFDEGTGTGARIKVIGVGGGGGKRRPTA